MLDHPLHVVVKFGSDIPVTVRGPALLEFERLVRKLSGMRAEVFMAAKGDDSKLRNAMTQEQRDKL